MKTFALVDCNNFYVSCERVFNPKIRHEPVIVLSNNDGCVIARSNESKALGIAMGTPYYQIKKFCEQHNIHVFSSNYSLYGDLSQRIMNILHAHIEHVEEYSIDEAFLRFDTLNKKEDMLSIAKTLRETILKWVGVPVSVGMAPTKVLAKIANHIAKKNTQSNIFGLFDAESQKRILSSFSVGDIWGIGQQLKKGLSKHNIITAWQLREAPEKIIRQNFSVILEKIILELRGTSCMDLEIKKPRQEIVVSRSFGKEVSSLNEIKEAASNYAVRACEKLRGQKSRANAITVFISANRFTSTQCYSNSLRHIFQNPTDDTRRILAAVSQCIDKIYRPDIGYKKVGVKLTNLQPAAHHQLDLISMIDPMQEDKSQNLMRIIDEINRSNSKNTLFFASQGIERAWAMRREHASPRYTTSWGELLNVR